MEENRTQNVHKVFNKNGIAGKKSHSSLKISYAKGSSEVGQLNIVNKFCEGDITTLNVSK